MPKEKQLFQVQNILETLIEATDHFSTLIKDKEINQSIYMFSSIVEGSQAITTMLLEEDKNFAEPMQKLEQYLLLISKELEQGRLMKVSEVIQFSLRPLFVRLQESFIEEVGDFLKDTISIGIFHSFNNPKDFYPENRIHATLAEGKKQKTNLYFFTSEDIDFETEQITADTYEKDAWRRVTVPFPDVINNVGAGKRSQAERKLQRMVPFTGFHVGNKYTLPKKMLKHRKYTDLLVPFIVCMNEDSVYRFMEKNNHVVFKALKSNRGENIYFVNKKGSRFVILDQKKERILSGEEFHRFLTRTILAEKGSFIVQRYIHTRTKDDEPYHFRAHMQKNHKDEWELTHIYPRIGSKKSNLSNIATEGRVEDFPAFLRNQFGDKQGATYEKDILDLSIHVTNHLDKIYGMGLNELGIDFAIDETGKVWMHEANNGPQTAFHEEKRAINFIAYAKYIAENGLMRTNQIDGQFQARHSKLPIADDSFETCVGMLIQRQSSDSISLTLANTAADQDIPFYSFTPRDVDYDLGLIRASFVENGEWVQKIAEYPTVIIDRLKMRSATEDFLIYEELEDIPFINPWIPNSVRRSTIYETLQENEETKKHVVDFQSVKRPLHVFQYIERYEQVQLKQEDMDHKHPVLFIRACKDHRFEVNDGSTKKSYTTNELRNFINHRIEEKPYIVQAVPGVKEGRAFIMKNGENDWTTVSNYTETDEAMHTTLDEKMYALATQTADALENKFNETLSELALSFSIEEANNVYILDVNPNGPRTIQDIEGYAKNALSYALLLSE